MTVTVLALPHTPMCTRDFPYGGRGRKRWPKHEADHSYLSNSKVVNQWSYTSTTFYI